MSKCGGKITTKGDNGGLDLAYMLLQLQHAPSYTNSSSRYADANCAGGPRRVRRLRPHETSIQGLAGLDCVP